MELNLHRNAQKCDQVNSVKYSDQIMLNLCGEVSKSTLGTKAANQKTKLKEVR